MEQNQFTRTALLIGEEAVEYLKTKKVVVFGVGGVGSFTVEALTRSGVGTIVLVDSDTVCVTNINRQIHAIHNSVDKVKVQLMKERVLSINPNCNVMTHETFVNAGNIEDIITEDVDYVVDAIDTISSKIDLAIWCEKHNVPLISSMGTGNKLDPTQFKVTDVYKTKVCPLAKVMRYELKRRGVKKLKVVYSEEMPRKPYSPQNTSKKEDADLAELKRTSKRQTPGSISFVPPVAGMILAAEVVRDLIKDYL